MVKKGDGIAIAADDDDEVRITVCHKTVLISVISK